MIRKFLQLYIPAVLVVLIAVVGVQSMHDNTTVQTAVAQEQTDTHIQTNRYQRRQILWLARIIYSETKRADEQPVIAWVVRNRVDSPRFQDSYKAVARANGQFSGLHPRDRQYRHNITREYGKAGDAWQHALEVAKGVYNAPEALRPFPQSMQHFYSPISVKETPTWAHNQSPEYTIKDPQTNETRFAFFTNIR